MGMLVIGKVYGVILNKNKGKILEENTVQSAFQQTLEYNFTCQQDNNLKHKSKHTYTGVAYQDNITCS